MEKTIAKFMKAIKENLSIEEYKEVEQTVEKTEYKSCCLNLDDMSPDAAREEFRRYVIDILKLRETEKLSAIIRRFFWEEFDKKDEPFAAVYKYKGKYLLMLGEFSPYLGAVCAGVDGKRKLYIPEEVKKFTHIKYMYPVMDEKNCCWVLKTKIGDFTL